MALDRVCDGALHPRGASLPDPCGDIEMVCAALSDMAGERIDRPGPASALLKCFLLKDVAKRLVDYGFHAPTMSWPVADSFMIEPTESESKAELDRFCEAMISIKNEIKDVMDGKLDTEDNPLKNAPHTALHVASDDWNHPYNRKRAAYPASWLRQYKYWPTVGRIDNAFGDRNLICTCPIIDEYKD